MADVGERLSWISFVNPLPQMTCSLEFATVDPSMYVTTTEYLEVYWSSVLFP